MFVIDGYKPGTENENLCQTPKEFEDRATEHRGVMFCGHGPQPGDPSGLALNFNSNMITFLRPHDLNVERWSNMIFVSTA